MTVLTPDIYATHLSALAWVARHYAIQAALEFGGGLYSTPALLNFPDLCLLVTVEPDPDWRAILATALKDDVRHAVVSDYDGSLDEFDLIMVDDGKTEQERVRTLRRVCAAQPRGLVVVHDWENAAYRAVMQDYDWQPVRVFMEQTPQTAIFECGRDNATA